MTISEAKDLIADRRGACDGAQRTAVVLSMRGTPEHLEYGFPEW